LGGANEYVALATGSALETAVTPTTRIVLVGAAVVVAFDATASLLLSRLGGSLAWMFLGEGLLYVAVGFAAGRIGGLAAGARSAAAVAAVDSTLGWAVTWVVGTGRVSRVTPVSVAFVLLTMVATGAAAGSAGAFGAQLLGRRSTAGAGFMYFALVMGAGFLLGTIRVPLLVPRIGERWAELAEMPVMAVTIYYSAGYVLRRFPDANEPSGSLVVGLLALGLLVSAELSLAVALQSRSLAEYLDSRDKVSGSVYLVLLVVFALMPRLRLRR
jgi:hypothetical protein